MDDLLDQR